VPRDWKNALFAVVTAPPGKYVVVWPVRSTVVVVCGKVAGTLPNRMVGSSGILRDWFHAAVTHDGREEEPD
jgi:hypothetical protein